jgi:hypothetical protein
MSINQKIKAARVLLTSFEKEEQYLDQNIIQKLHEVTDKAELVYNDVKIKRIRSKSAFQSMKDIEHKLDLLIREAKTKKL